MTRQIPTLTAPERAFCWERVNNCSSLSAINMHLLPPGVKTVFRPPADAQAGALPEGTGAAGRTTELWARLPESRVGSPVREDWPASKTGGRPAPAHHAPLFWQRRPKIPCMCCGNNQLWVDDQRPESHPAPPGRLLVTPLPAAAPPAAPGSACGPARRPEPGSQPDTDRPSAPRWRLPTAPKLTVPPLSA